MSERFLLSDGSCVNLESSSARCYRAIDCTETDTLPIGGERKQWNRETVERKTERLPSAEQLYRGSAIKGATEQQAMQFACDSKHSSLIFQTCAPI